MNPDVTVGNPVYSDTDGLRTHENSSIEVAHMGANGGAGNIRIDPDSGTMMSSFFARGDRSLVSPQTLKLRLGSSVDGVQDVICVVCNPVGTGLDSFGSLIIREYI